MKTKIILTGIATTTLVFSLTAMSVFAAPAGRQNSAAVSNGGCAYCYGDCQFIDEDGDGICDNYAAGGHGACGNRGRHHGGKGHHRR